MAEFAFVLPVLLVFFLGIVSGGLLLFVAGSANAAAANAAHLDAELGNSSSADTSAVAAIRTGLAGPVKVTEVDIYRMTLTGSQLSADSTATNIYRIDGTVIQKQWSPTMRNVAAGSQEYLGITVKYRLAAGSGPFATTSLTAVSVVQLEPQAAAS